MEKITGLIVCGFPGVGKTTAALNSYRYVIDVQSSKFRWNIDELGMSTHTENKYWVSDYVDYIRHLASSCRYPFVLVSTHAEVRKELDERRIPYVVVVPNKDLRDEYLIRYIQRGDTYSFINTIYNHWKEWLDEIEESDKPIIHLTTRQTISDILPRGFKNME